MLPNCTKVVTVGSYSCKLHGCRDRVEGSYKDAEIPREMGTSGAGAAAGGVSVSQPRCSDDCIPEAS
jgi:hypothetical protein